jgi:hypothetical protein
MSKTFLSQLGLYAAALVSALLTEETEANQRPEQDN